MTLQVLGCSHHDAAVEFRERVSFSVDQVTAALVAFRERFPSGELVLLSTCNRVELYSSLADSQINRERLAEFLADQHHLSASDVLAHTIHRVGGDAIEHLFTVAASLDSMVLGEAQILAQVKQSYDLACSAGTAGPMIHAAFQAANRVAKRIHHDTAIHRRRVSVPSVAVGEIVPEVFESLGDKHVILCGAGEMGEETLRYLRQAGAERVCILNRSPERAQQLAANFGVASAPWETLAEQLVKADLLIGTTSSPEPIVTAAKFTSLHPRRQGRVLLILDLAVPRDIEPSVGEFSNVYLYQIDDLQAACERNRREREKEWPKAKRIITEEVERFLREQNNRVTGPIVRRLREQAEQLKSEELRRLVSKLGDHAQNQEVAQEIEKSFDRLINKLLHGPLASVRDDAAAGHRQGLLNALRHLFQLGDD